MKIIIRENPTGNQPHTETGAIIEGKHYADLVATLMVHSPFMGASTAANYMDKVLQGLGSTISLVGDAEAHCRQFIRHLASKGLIGFCYVAGPDEFPDRLWEAILLIRDTGATNMLDYPVVASFMKECGYSNESKWVIENRNRYVELIFGNTLDSKGAEACADK